MRKIKFIIHYIPLLFCSLSFGQNKDSVQLLEQIEDFKLFKQEITANSAGLYFYNDSTSIEEQFNLLENALKKPLNAIELYQYYARFTAEIHCGHTQIGSLPVRKRILTEHSLFPLKTCIENRRLFIAKSDSIAGMWFEKGTEILEINQQKIETIYPQLYALIPSDGLSSSLQHELISSNFFLYYFVAIDQRGYFNIQLKTSKGDTISVCIDAIRPNFKSYKKFHHHSPKFKFELDSALNYAYLRLPSPLWDGWFYQLKIQHYIKKANQNKINYLILDLRNNTGGLSQYHFARYFTDTSYTFERNYYVGKTRPNQHYIRPLNDQRIACFILRNFRKKGKIKQEITKPTHTHFNGQIFVLTNGYTFSAASNLAANLQFYSKAIVVGDESGGSYLKGSTGNLSLKLPHSGIIVQINPIVFENVIPNNGTQGGVLPNHNISDSKLTDEDEQMQFILQQLIQH